jgi:hypothetical protein
MPRSVANARLQSLSAPAAQFQTLEINPIMPAMIHMQNVVAYQNVRESDRCLQQFFRYARKQMVRIAMSYLDQCESLYVGKASLYDSAHLNTMSSDASQNTCSSSRGTTWLSE